MLRGGTILCIIEESGCHSHNLPQLRRNENSVQPGEASDNEGGESEVTTIIQCIVNMSIIHSVRFSNVTYISLNLSVS